VRGRAVDEDRSLVPHQGYPVEPCDQRLLAGTFDRLCRSEVASLVAPRYSQVIIEAVSRDQKIHEADRSVAATALTLGHEIVARDRIVARVSGLGLLEPS
jgi:hypothetical protein